MRQSEACGWTITDHAKAQWAERVGPAGDGAERTILMSLAQARPPSRGQRKRLNARWREIGRGGPGRTFTSRNGAYLLMSRDICFVCTRPKTLITVYKVDQAVTGQNDPRRRG